MVSWNEAAENTERVCKRRLGDAEQNRTALGGLAALVDGLLVGLVELEQVDLLAGKQRGVATVGDLHLLHHLAARSLRCACR